MESLSRRRFIEAAAGLGLSLWLPRGASASTRPARSLITLWLQGGASQLETWDPHPNTKIGGPTMAIPTRIEGLKISSDFPRMAEMIDRLSVIRSLVSKEGDHQRASYYLKTGYRPNPTVKHPSIGAHIAHGKRVDGLKLPGHIALGGGNNPPRGGFLGPALDAFKVVDPGKNVGNLRPKITEESRGLRRLQNLDVLAASFRRGRVEEVEATHHAQTVDRALEMMRSEDIEAFELDREPAEARTRYGDTRFGRGCLVARRLVERGVPAVEVTLTGFDSHASNFEAHKRNAHILDPAFASLISDLEARDLLRTTVVLCISEFGRTPKINPLAGRDHWPRGFSCVVGGGGLRAGRLLGATDPEGASDPKDPIAVEDLAATVLHQVGLDPSTELYTPAGRPIQLSSGTPLRGLRP